MSKEAWVLENMKQIRAGFEPPLCPKPDCNGKLRHWEAGHVPFYKICDCCGQQYEHVGGEYRPDIGCVTAITAEMTSRWEDVDKLHAETKAKVEKRLWAEVDKLSAETLAKFS